MSRSMMSIAFNQVLSYVKSNYYHSKSHITIGFSTKKRFAFCSNVWLSRFFQLFGNLLEAIGDMQITLKFIMKVDSKNPLQTRLEYMTLSVHQWFLEVQPAFSVVMFLSVLGQVTILQYKKKQSRMVQKYDVVGTKIKYLQYEKP